MQDEVPSLDGAASEINFFQQIVPRVNANPYRFNNQDLLNICFPTATEPTTPAATSTTSALPANVSPEAMAEANAILRANNAASAVGTVPLNDAGSPLPLPPPPSPSLPATQGNNSATVLIYPTNTLSDVQPSNPPPLPPSPTTPGVPTISEEDYTSMFMAELAAELKAERQAKEQCQQPPPPPPPSNIPAAIPIEQTPNPNPPPLPKTPTPTRQPLPLQPTPVPTPVPTLAPTPTPTLPPSPRLATTIPTQIPPSNVGDAMLDRLRGQSGPSPQPTQSIQRSTTVPSIVSRASPVTMLSQVSPHGIPVRLIAQQQQQQRLHTKPTVPKSRFALLCEQRDAADQAERMAEIQRRQQPTATTTTTTTTATATAASPHPQTTTLGQQQQRQPLQQTVPAAVPGDDINWQREQRLRRRGLKELEKLKRCDVSIDREWSMNDSSRSMQREIREIHRQFQSNDNKETYTTRISWLAQFVKFVNALFNLRLPGLESYDQQVKKIMKKPVALYMLEEACEVDEDFDLQDPNTYLVNELGRPILYAIGVRLLMFVFQTFMHIRDDRIQLFYQATNTMLNNGFVPTDLLEGLSEVQGMGQLGTLLRTLGRIGPALGPVLNMLSRSGGNGGGNGNGNGDGNGGGNDGGNNNNNNYGPLGLVQNLMGAIINEGPPAPSTRTTPMVNSHPATVAAPSTSDEVDMSIELDAPPSVGFLSS
jgi:hypothetical protein